MSFKEVALETKAVESFSHTAIADEQLDTQGLPFDDDFFRGVIPVVIKHVPGTRNGNLKSLGSNHGRSYELSLDTPEASEKPIRTVFTDRYGNTYTSFSTKGNNFSRALIIRTLTAPADGHMPYGLQEDSAFARNVISTNKARAAKVDTEWISRAEEPKELLFGSELVNPDIYKRLIIAQHIGDHAVKGVDEDLKATIEGTKKLEKAIEDMNFFVTLRAMSTNLRISDLISESSDLRQGLFNDLYQIYNLIAPQRKEDFELLGLPEHIDANEVGYGDYLTIILPKLIGCNMARLHTAGMVHVFPHPGNINGMGGLVDFDSTKGEVLGLGDKPITASDMAEDILYPLNTESLEGQRFRELLEKFDGPLPGHWQKADELFMHNLLQSYCAVRATIPNDNGSTKSTMEVMIELGSSGLDVAARRVVDIAYDVAQGPIEKLITEITEERPIDARKLASHIYEMCVAPHENDLWSEMPPKGKYPIRTDLNNALLAWLGKMDTEGNMVTHESHLVSYDVFRNHIEPYLLDQVYETTKSELQPIMETVRSELAGTGLEDLNDESMAALFSLYIWETDGYNHFVIPGAKEFWAEMQQEFAKHYADSIDFSIVQDQEFIKPEADEILEPYFHNWNFHESRLMHVYDKVPLEIFDQILKVTVEPTIVNTPAEVLDLHMGKRDDVQLAITDGNVLYFGIRLTKNEKEEGFVSNYPYSYSPNRDPQPTQSIFLVENLDDHSFRLVFNKLKDN